VQSYPLTPPFTAIVRHMSANFVSALQQAPPVEPINMDLAISQHSAYVRTLRTVVPKVVELPADHNHPDCCFVEDTAVIIGRRAAISCLGAPSRRGEEKIVRITLRECGLRTTLMEYPATMDGGDILFTGKHLIIGLSERTNDYAVDQLALIFDDVEIVSVKVRESLHLKSVMSAFDPDLLIFGENDSARDLHEQLSTLGVIGDGYSVAWVPDPLAANVLNLGKHILIQDGFPASESILVQLAAERHKTVHKIQMSEFIKADGALTCCSLVF
jgi:dimethylargininase